MNFLFGPKDIAKAFGWKDESWVHKLVKQGYPAPVNGKYALDKWIQKREADHKEELRSTRSRSTSAIDRRLQEIELERAERKNHQEKLELISVAEVTRLWDRIVIAVKRRIESQGTRLAPRLLNLTLLSQPKRILDQDNQETLIELATGDPAPDGRALSGGRKSLPKDDVKVRANAKSKRKRVG